MRKINFEQGSDEWLSWRKTLLTATDASVIMGVSPYCTPYKLWQRKIGQIPEQAVTAPMLRGQRDEPRARELFCKMYRMGLTPCCIESEKYPFLGASLDGLSDCENYIVEIKSQSPDKIANGIPPMHIAQMQHQMLCTDGKVQKAFYVSYWENAIDVLILEFDEEGTKNYLLEAQAFWNKMLAFEAPPLSKRDYKDMSSVQAWNIHADNYKNICAQIKALEDAKDQSRKNLIDLAGDDNGSGCGVKVLKKYVKGRVDYDAIPELKSLDLETYRKAPSSNWTIMLDSKS